MADNAVMSAAVGVGITVAGDDIGGIFYPRGKLSLGADNTAVDAGAGAGVVGTDTQRVTLGSDDPAVVALELIDNAVSGLGFNITQFAGAGISMGTGVRDAGTQRVTIATDDEPPGRYDSFGKAVTTSNKNSIDVQFFRGAPETLVKVTSANSATATANNGGALFASGTNTSGSVQGVTHQNTIYRSGSEVYAMFTATFTSGVASSYMRLGLYDANNGFFIGYEGTSFGLTVRNNAADVTTAKGSWSEDTLTGDAESKFTRAGVPEAINLTKLNVWRIRFGWLGSAPLVLEVMAPDGHWVTCHKVLYPNLQTTPSIRSADLPITLDITKTSAGATDLQIQTDCWGAGTNSGVGNLGDSYAFQTVALLNNGATFSSGVKTLSPEYAQVQTTILASHNGSIDIYWYHDRAGTDLVRTLTIPYVAANGFQLYSAPAFTPFVKYEFTNNSGSNQTDFHFDTKFLHQSLSPQMLRVDGTLLGGMVATVNKSVIAGETTGGGGGYVNVKVSPSGAVNVAAAQDGTWDVGLLPRTSGGLTMHKTTSAASTNATSVKASAGQVYNLQVFNVNAAVRYLKLYNKASAPTVGTDTPVKTLAIPGNTAGSGFAFSWPQGLAFETGIAFALTTEATDAGTTGVAANEITVNLDYK